MIDKILKIDSKQAVFEGVQHTFISLAKTTGARAIVVYTDSGALLAEFTDSELRIRVDAMARFDPMDFGRRDYPDPVLRGTTSDMFEDVYVKGIWEGGGSGLGSVNSVAIPYASAVAELSSRHGWSSCVDVGCGDGRVANLLSFDYYLGLEASPSAIELFRKNCPGKMVRQLDFYKQRDEIPFADVLLAKDVLNHWPDKWVDDWVAWACTCGKFRAVICTQDYGSPVTPHNELGAGSRWLAEGVPPLDRSPLRVARRIGPKAMLVWVL